MSEITFEDESEGRNKKREESSAMTNFLIEHSFGVLTSKRHAEIFMVIISLALLTAIFYTRDARTTVEQPSDELINAKQPVRSL